MQLEDEFGDIIAKSRIGNGMNEAQLGAKVGLSLHEMQAIESYRLTPKQDVIDRLSAVLGLNAHKLAAIAEQSWTPKPPDPSNEIMVVRKIPVPYGAYGENAYVLGCLRTRMAGVVDPGGAIEQINDCLTAESLIPSIVLITHSHGDHIDGLKDLLAQHTGVIVASSTLDREAVMRGISTPWQPADDGSRLDVGELKVTPLSTPGHTGGSTCYATNGACFVGDTLFSASIGRPSSALVYPHMLEAIRSKVLSLPGNTALFPGHGPATTVAQETEHNPFF